jgi:hypothetical protein
VQDAREDVAAELVPAHRVLPRRPRQGGAELLLERIGGRQPRARHRHDAEADHQCEAGKRGAVAPEAPPRRDGWSRPGLRRQREAGDVDGTDGRRDGGRVST